MKTLFSACLALMLVIVLNSCEEDSGFELLVYPEEDYELISQYLNIASVPPEYDLEVPTGNATVTRSISVNDNQAELGRVLFYDKNLSKDRTVSCESCHQQALAFSDDVDFSIGVEGRKTVRNSQALGSVLSFSAYYGSPSVGGIPFFWDNRAESVQEQSEQTLANPQEMDMKMHEVVERVQELPYYEPLFKAAYADDKITSQKVLDALNEFINSMGTFDSPFDQELIKDGNPNRTFDTFSDSENLGKSLFMTNCASCHSSRFGRPVDLKANNGLDMEYEDKGIGLLTQDEADMGLFKIPTLRNIALTAPYMHDGRFETLEEVIDHYSSGVKAHKNLSSELKSSDEPKRFNFTDVQKQSLIDFLHTLTDETFITDEKYANPFK